MIDKQFEKEEFKKSVKENVKFLYRKTLEEATQEQIFQAVSYTVKDVIIDNWLKSQKAYEKQDPKIVYYMSMEFLMGRALGNNLINLGAYGEVKEALEELGLDINCIEDQEPDPALGNGGLGRLAACFLDSLATLNYCAYGCGIRYRYGMFKQEIRDGYQVEAPDNWLKNGYPFELRRPEYAKEVHFGGYVRVEWDPVSNQNKFIHEGYQAVKAVPYDMPITGYNNDVVNTLRIWDAEPIVDFNLDSFDKGDYHNAVEQENLARTIVEVLYPNDNHMAGKELRLKQQYFFVSASLQAAIAKYKKTHDDITKLHEKVVFQMNDTHPTVAVAELMRILIDEEGLGWDQANSQIRAFAAVTTDMVETARQNHNTSPVATAALGRLLTGGAMMGAMMKGEKDLLTLRIHAGGPLQGITVTADSHGNVKGYVGNPDVCIPANSKGKLDVAGAVGVGFMDVIKDMGLKEPYVGQVALQTSEIAEDLTYYFATSEQVPSAVGLGVLMNKNNTVRQAGGFIVQLMPFAEESTIAKLEENVQKITSVTNLLEEGHTPESLLEKVLEGFDMEINEKVPTEFYCNCSRERVEKALISIGRKELNEMIQEGKSIEMNCHFCNKNYEFTVEELKEILRKCK